MTAVPQSLGLSCLYEKVRQKKHRIKSVTTKNILEEKNYSPKTMVTNWQDDLLFYEQ
jgi:hypothetical protein